MDDQQQQSNGDRMDRFERGLEHLLEAQVRHETRSAARFERIERGQVEFRTDLAQLLKAQVLITDAQRKVTDAQREVIDVQREVTDSQGKLTDSHRVLDEKLAALAEAQRETTEKLNALIALVDGLVKRPPQGS